MYYPYYFDQLISLSSSASSSAPLHPHKVNSTYARYDQVRNHAGITGAMAAEQILRMEGIYDVQVMRVSGKRPIITIRRTMYCGFQIPPTVRHRLRHLELQHMNVDTRSSMQGIMYR